MLNALAAFVCVVTLLGIGPSRAADAVPFKKSPVKLIDTDLENMEPYPGPDRAAIWVDDHRLVATIPLERSAHDPKTIGRTVLYDLNTGKTQELMRYAHPLCWDAKTGNGGVVYYPNPDDTKKQEVLGIRVDQSGAVIERKVGASSARRTPDCDVTRKTTPGLPKHRIMMLRSEHGYIDLGVPGLKNHELFISLNRADGTQKQLPLYSRQATGGFYLPFLDQYQLNSGSSCRWQGERCPPEMYVMNPAGEVTTLPLPAEILKVIPTVSRAYVVKDGILILIYNLNAHGFFLWRNGALHELWRPDPPGFMKSGPTEVWGYETISPDGCKVAFMRGARPGRVFVFDHCSIGK